MILRAKTYGYRDMVTLAFRINPLYSTVFALHRLFTSLVSTFMIFITAYFINTATAIVQKKEVFSAIWPPIAMLAGVMLYHIMFGRLLMDLANKRAALRARTLLRPEVIRKRARLAYRHIENPKTADLIERVCKNADSAIPDMYNRILDVFGNLVFALGILLSLTWQVAWIGLCLFAVSIPVLIVATKAGKNSYKADKEVSKNDRRAGYLSEVLKSRDAVEERSVYGYSEALNDRYTEQFETARRFRLKVTAANFIKTKSGGLVTSAVSIASMLALLQPVAGGTLNLGMFIGLLNGVFDLSQRLSWGVNDLVEDLSRKREYLRDLTEFMALEEHEDAEALPAAGMRFSLLEFRDVTFRYPGTDAVILDRVSFVIESGKHYSFVGVNGAGKTTITKLITGLYPEYEGEILLDGRPLRELTQAQIKGLSSVVYQDFARYWITLRDNIALGSASDIDRPEAVEEAVALSGLSETVSDLPKGLDTPLGKLDEKGADLSGGQWQRVAMARSLQSPAPLKILDEPTAALDPVAESQVYEHFEQLSRGGTTVFISHRLGSTKLADTIYVLSGGRIAESGSHAALMAKNGVYAEMFASQAAWYSADAAEYDRGEAAARG